MNPNKALWEKGDFTRIAASMRESGEQLVRSIGAAPGMKVLDLGCGFGHHCRWMREQGAESVVGVDLSERMLERARAMTSDSAIEYRCCAI